MRTGEGDEMDVARRGLLYRRLCVVVVVVRERETQRTGRGELELDPYSSQLGLFTSSSPSSPVLPHQSTVTEYSAGLHSAHALIPSRLNSHVLPASLRLLCETQQQTSRPSTSASPTCAASPLSQRTSPAVPLTPAHTLANPAFSHPLPSSPISLPTVPTSPPTLSTSIPITSKHVDIAPYLAAASNNLITSPTPLSPADVSLASLLATFESTSHTFSLPSTPSSPPTTGFERGSEEATLISRLTDELSLDDSFNHADDSRILDWRRRMDGLKGYVPTTSIVKREERDTEEGMGGAPTLVGLEDFGVRRGRKGRGSSLDSDEDGESEEEDGSEESGSSRDEDSEDED